MRPASAPIPALRARAPDLARAARARGLARDGFGNLLLIKRLIMSAVNLCFYPVFRWLNPLRVVGADALRDLPPSGVLFVANHQTWFTDAIAMHQVFSAALAGCRDTGALGYLLRPHTGMYYVAARETMASGWIPRVLAYGSAVCVDRSWKEGDHLVSRQVDLVGVRDIGRALGEGWVITFPQGTTRPGAPGRIGAAHLIRASRPVVVPVVVQGFRDAFGRTGLELKHPGRPVSLHFKPPLALDYEAPAEVILSQVIHAIEQDRDHR